MRNTLIFITLISMFGCLYAQDRTNDITKVSTVADSFARNEFKAEKEYKDKRIKVLGVITDITKANNPEVSEILPCIFLSDSSISEYTIIVYFSNSDIETLASLSKGQEIVVEATFSNYINRLVMLTGKSIIQNALIFTAGDYSIGSKGQAGGLVFYDKGYMSDGWRYLECAPISETKKVKKQLGGINDGYIDETDSTVIGCGFENTNAIIKKQGNKDYAAQYCKSYQLGKYNDWFLPSKEELITLCLFLKEKDPSIMTSTNVFWSSSTIDSKNGIIYFFNYIDGVGDADKTFDCYVIPVRRF